MTLLAANKEMTDRIKAAPVKCRTTLTAIVKDVKPAEITEAGEPVTKRTADQISGDKAEESAVKKEKSDAKTDDAKPDDAAVKPEAAAPATEDTEMKTEKTEDKEVKKEEVKKEEVKKEEVKKEDTKDAGKENPEHAAGDTLAASEAGDGEKCPWVGTIETVGEHMKSCQFRTIKCEQGHNAANKGCQEMVQKRGIESHRKERCGFRKVPCKFCKKDYQVQTRP